MSSLKRLMRRRRARRAGKPLPQIHSTDLAADLLRLETFLQEDAERTCGDCQECCVVFEVPELEKAEGARCAHQCATGCAIWGREERPAECGAFKCLYLEGWVGSRPSETHVIGRRRHVFEKLLGFAPVLDLHYLETLPREKMKLANAELASVVKLALALGGLADVTFPKTTGLPREELSRIFCHDRAKIEKYLGLWPDRNQGERRWGGFGTSSAAP